MVVLSSSARRLLASICLIIIEIAAIVYRSSQQFMTYKSQYKTFVFENYKFDTTANVATFRYRFDDDRYFVETVHFSGGDNYDSEVLERTLFVAFVLAGISYYKCFPTKHVEFANHSLSPAQADFFSEVYRDGLSQFVYENNLTS